MAKKQTRRSISVSRTTYERLKAFCETNHISMSQLVETRVNDFLGPNDVASGAMGSPLAATTAGAPVPSSAPRPVSSMAQMAPRAVATMGSIHAQAAAAPSKPVEARPQPAPPAPAPVAPQPMTSAAARFAVDPPPPIIKPRQDTAAPKPAEKRPEQIFTF